MPEIHFKKNLPNAKIPTRGSEDAACHDLYAAQIVLDHKHNQIIVNTGLSTSFNYGYALMIYARSGLAMNHGIRLANGVGVIDADYRGPLKVMLKYDNGNLIDFVSNRVFAIGDRIAQCKLEKVEYTNWIEVDELPESQRGEGGFGSSGLG